MRRAMMLAGLVMAGFLFMTGTGARAAAMTEKEKAQKEPFPNDLGPDAIDVSTYPADMQDKYKMFTSQCNQCHVINRPINSEIFDDAKWKRYVKRMKTKPGCTITKAKEIYLFLAFDSVERKIKHKAEWKAHRVDLLTQFKAKFPDRYKLLFEDRSPEAEAKKELPGW